MNGLRAPHFQNSNSHGIEVMCVKDVAAFLKRSQSWVYKNFEQLGGVKIGGSVLFPSKEKIYERLFQQQERMVGVFLPSQKETVHGSRIPEEKGRPGSRGRKKKGCKTAKEGTGDNRHGLLDLA